MGFSKEQLQAMIASMEDGETVEDLNVLKVNYEKKVEKNGLKASPGNGKTFSHQHITQMGAESGRVKLNPIGEKASVYEVDKNGLSDINSRKVNNSTIQGDSGYRRESEDIDKEKEIYKKRLDSLVEQLMSEGIRMKGLALVHAGVKTYAEFLAEEEGVRKNLARKNLVKSLLSHNGLGKYGNHRNRDITIQQLLRAAENGSPVKGYSVMMDVISAFSKGERASVPLEASDKCKMVLAIVALFEKFEYTNEQVLFAFMRPKSNQYVEYKRSNQKATIEAFRNSKLYSTIQEASKFIKKDGYFKLGAIDYMLNATGDPEKQMEELVVENFWDKLLIRRLIDIMGTVYVEKEPAKLAREDGKDFKEVYTKLYADDALFKLNRIVEKATIVSVRFTQLKGLIQSFMKTASRDDRDKFWEIISELRTNINDISNSYNNRGWEPNSATMESARDFEEIYGPYQLLSGNYWIIEDAVRELLPPTLSSTGSILEYLDGKHYTTERPQCIHPALHNMACFLHETLGDSNRRYRNPYRGVLEYAKSVSPKYQEEIKAKHGSK